MVRYCPGKGPCMVSQARSILLSWAGDRRELLARVLGQRSPWVSWRHGEEALSSRYCSVAPSSCPAQRCLRCAHSWQLHINMSKLLIRIVLGRHCLLPLATAPPPPQVLLAFVPRLHRLCCWKRSQWGQGQWEVATHTLYAVQLLHYTCAHKWVCVHLERGVIFLFLYKITWKMY